MSFCTDCGVSVNLEWDYCPDCGQSIRPEVCPCCGKALEQDWSYCPGCGRNIADMMELIALASESAKADPIGLFHDIEEADTETGDEEAVYAFLVSERERLRRELHRLDDEARELNRSDEEFADLSAEEKKQLGERRRELRSRQGRCHAELLGVAGRIRKLAEREAKRGRELFSREHPEVLCPNCGSKLRKGVDTWPLCPFCGEDVTAPGRPSSCTVLLKVNCGEKDVRRVWYTGNRDFFDYWEAFSGRHSKHEYHFSAERAVLTVEDAKNRSERTASELPEELPPFHTLLKQARFSGEIDGERVDGIRTENLGTVDLAELSEAERLAFLKLLLALKPDREKRRFTLA